MDKTTRTIDWKEAKIGRILFFYGERRIKTHNLNKICNQTKY